ELEEGAQRVMRRLADMDGDHQLARPEGRAAIAGDEARERQVSRTAGSGELDPGVERKQRRHAVGGGRGIAEIAGERAGILDLPAADLARRLLQPVEQRRQWRVEKLAPGRRGAEPPAVRAG